MGLRLGLDKTLTSRQSSRDGVGLVNLVGVTALDKTVTTRVCQTGRLDNGARCSEDTTCRGGGDRGG